LKRLAKMFVESPSCALGSYQATQGVARPGPAKSIDGASATTVGVMLSDAGRPSVTQAPFLNARTKICCQRPTFCSNVAHGIWTLPATTVPPATSTRPASWLGSIEFVGSSFTWAPFGGSDTKAAEAGGARSSARQASSRDQAIECACHFEASSSARVASCQPRTAVFCLSTRSS